MKKLFALILALAMVLSLAATGFATAVDGTDYTTETTAVTITNTSHTFNAYKLLNATVSKSDEEGATENIAYTINSKYSEVLATVTGKTEDADIIAYISNLSGDAVRTFGNTVYAKIQEKSIEADATVTGNTAAQLVKGYWMFVDVTNTDGEDDSKSKVIVDTSKTDSLEITAKLDVPTIEKKVDDNNDTVAKKQNKTALTGEWWNSDDIDWQNSADHDIGDVIPYRIKVELPDNLDDYTSGYNVKINDTMSAGLTYNEDAVVVIEGNKVEEGYTVNYANNVLTIEFTDIKPYADNDDVLYVYYTCTLNENAVIGVAGNPNTVDLIYSNEPDSDGKGKTAPDTVIVFTYKATVNKVDTDNNPLAGAGFTLYKKVDTEWVEIEAIAATETGVEFGFTGLDDGEYKLVETTVPVGYNKIDDIFFEVAATHTEGAEPALTALAASGTIGENGEAITISSNMTDGAIAGELEMSVVNNSGTELPSTGGMGTTMFYLVGGFMVMAAAVLLVTKKRMSVEF